MKILRPFTGTGGIFFPIGPPPKGTCEFATAKCSEHCYAKRTKYPDFDEELLLTDEELMEIYEAFISCPKMWLLDEVRRELDGLQTSILHWFGSGDCTSKDLERVNDLVDLFADAGIVQMGFTRNRILWERHKDIFALTVESKKEMGNDKGMFAMPDYKRQISKMFFNGEPTSGGLCGPLTCRDRTRRALEHYINCQTCRRLCTGCFDRPVGFGGQESL
jgi:hypothetical protein